MSVDVIQLIQTVTAVDPDEPLGGQHFYYSLSPEVANNPNFTLRDNQGRLNTLHLPCKYHDGCVFLACTVEHTHLG